MYAKKCFLISLVAVLGSIPCISYSQSLGDLLKFVPKGGATENINNINNIIGAIKSLSEVTTGNVAPGTEPENVGEKIILYRTASCAYCKRAEAYMQRKNVGFVERDIEKNSTYRAEFSKLGGRGVPFIVFHEKTMSGFDEGTFEQNYAEFKQAIKSPLPPQSTAQNSVSGSLSFQSGDVLLAKISGINVYARPTKSERLMALAQTDEIVYMGEERDGFYRVTTSKGEGWIEKILVKKK